MRYDYVYAWQMTDGTWYWAPADNDDRDPDQSVPDGPYHYKWEMEDNAGDYLNLQEPTIKWQCPERLRSWRIHNTKASVIWNYMPT